MRVIGNGCGIIHNHIKNRHHQPVFLLCPILHWATVLIRMIAYFYTAIPDLMIEEGWGRDELAEYHYKVVCCVIYVEFEIVTGLYGIKR